MAAILWTGWQHSHGLRGNIPVDWVAEIRGIRTRGSWSHEFVQSQFNGLLIGRRKRYPLPLRRILRDTMEVREKADYTPSPVSARVAARVLQAGQTLVAAVEEHCR